VHGQKDPLHGVTLQRMLEELVAAHGWPGLAERVQIRCFQFDPSVSSSLKFLRRTPWARAEVEALYRELVRLGQGDAPRPGSHQGRDTTTGDPAESSTDQGGARPRKPQAGP
jgi:uncharacterized protein (DUF2132 family)